jgi:hypothetical protein
MGLDIVIDAVFQQCSTETLPEYCRLLLLADTNSLTPSASRLCMLSTNPQILKSVPSKVASYERMSHTPVSTNLLQSL